MAKSVRMLNGYRVVYDPENSKAMQNENWNGYVYEHIKMAQIYLGRDLRPEEEVHHLDGNRVNNTESNLLVLECGQHTKLHGWLRGATGSEMAGAYGVNSGKSEIEEQYACPVCGKALRSLSNKTCSKECAEISARKVDRPSWDTLQEDLSTMPMIKVGVKYGVSDNAIRKWIKSYSKTDNPEPS